MTRDQKWLATHQPGNLDPAVFEQSLGYDRTAVGVDATVELLASALLLMAERNTHPETAPEPSVLVVVNGADLLADPRVENALDSLLRYGRKAGMTVEVTS